MQAERDRWPDTGRPAFPADFRLTIVTDAWRPHINGVARTYEWLARELPCLGVTPRFITLEGYPTIGMPAYRDIQLALALPWSVASHIEDTRPDLVHVATEGPLGDLARRHRPFERGSTGPTFRVCR